MVYATYVKARKNGLSVSQAILVVAAINAAGQREILIWREADVEFEDTWTDVFRELKQPGVNGVNWIISDGHLGIQAAVRTQFNGVSWQRCWTHFIRNAMNKVGHQHKETLAVHHLPQQHRRRVYTTNMLERVMKETKRRTNVVGIFPNEATAERLIERHEKWSCEKMRYLLMYHLEEHEPKKEQAVAA